MATSDYEPTFVGPWFCVLDPFWSLLYLGTDELAAAAEKAATPGAVLHKAKRMGDAMSGAAFDVGNERRRRPAA